MNRASAVPVIFVATLLSSCGAFAGAQKASVSLQVTEHQAFNGSERCGLAAHWDSVI